MNCTEIMLRQLAADFDTTPEALAGGCNLFTKKQDSPLKRAYENGGAGLNILCTRGIAVCCAADERLLDVIKREYAGYDAAWFLEIRNLHRLEEILKPFGQTASSLHLYFIPGADSPAPKKPDGYSFVWYEGGGIEQFRGDERFSEAFAFSPDYPDRLAVAAQRGDKIFGMAGASEDSKTMWQIGINVDAESRGKGIAAALTAALKEELLRRGILPFYGTSVSHTVSQKVAVGAGFVPAWTELYTKSV